MKNLRPIQLFVRDELKAFLSLEDREYFARNHQELIDNLRKEQWIEGNDWKSNYQCFDDFAFVSELARFLDDLELWNEEMGEIRGEYCYDKTTNELPKEFLLVFGFTSPITKRLDYLRSRCEVIVGGIENIVGTTKVETITLRDLHECCKSHRPTPAFPTVRGWAKQLGFPVAIGGIKDKTYPRAEVLDWVRTVKGINI